MKMWTMKEKKFLTENTHLTDKELAKMLNVRQTQVEGARARFGIGKLRDGKFRKGHKTHNKGKKQEEYLTPEKLELAKSTRFKPGREIKEERPMYTVFERKDFGGRPYLYIKLPNRKAYPYGRYVYEQSTGGKLTRYQVIVYKDGNHRNCTPDNLECITRGELVSRTENRRKAAETRKARNARVSQALSEYFN